jgi:hypothetical protein
LRFHLSGERSEASSRLTFDSGFHGFGRIDAIRSRENNPQTINCRASMLRQRPIWISLLVLWTMVVTLLRAVRTPNDYSEVHWLLSYQFGFVKRGLIGEVLSRICSLFYVPVSERLVLILSSIAFACCFILLYIVALRILRRFNWSAQAVLAVLVFASSPYLVMGSHLLGYFDNIIIIFGIASIALLLADRPWWGAVLQGIAMFVHESAFLIIFPLFCLAWLLKQCQQYQAHKPSGSWKTLVLPVVAFLTVSIAHAANMTPKYEAELTSFLNDQSFIGHHYVVFTPKLLVEPLFADFLDEAPQMGSKLGNTQYTGIALPSALALVFFMVSSFKIRGYSLELLILLGACFASQLMHTVACDTARIGTFAIVCSFLSLWIYSEIIPLASAGSMSDTMGLNFAATKEYRTVEGEPSSILTSIVILCLIVFALNIVSLTPLMNMQEERFGLKMRLLLYAPALFVVLSVLWPKRGPGLRGGLIIQGENILEILPAVFGSKK